MRRATSSRAGSSAISRRAGTAAPTRSSSLTKADLAEDPLETVAEAEAVAFGVPVHAVSSVTGEGLDELDPYLASGRTVALLGSSGVGKSTLANRLLGEELLATGEVRRDGRGRHTTTHRELVQLPGGALLLDTPGMRELQLWADESALEETFADVAELAAAVPLLGLRPRERARLRGATGARRRVAASRFAGRATPSSSASCARSH